MKLSVATVALVFSLSAPSAFAVKAVNSARALDVPGQDDSVKKNPTLKDLDRATRGLLRQGYYPESRAYHTVLPNAASPGQDEDAKLRQAEITFKKRGTEERQSLLLTYSVNRRMPNDLVDLVRVTKPVGTTILDLDSFLEELRADATHGATLSSAVDALRGSGYELSGMTTATVLPLTGSVPTDTGINRVRLSLTLRHPISKDVRMVVLSYTAHLAGGDGKHLTKVEVLVPLKK